MLPHKSVDHSERVPYDRAVLTTVLVYHYRKDARFCGCGWGELGRSHPDHVADVYEQSAVERKAQ